MAPCHVCVWALGVCVCVWGGCQQLRALFVQCNPVVFAVEFDANINQMCFIYFFFFGSWCLLVCGCLRDAILFLISA